MTTYDEIFPGLAPVQPATPLPQQAGLASGATASPLPPLPKTVAKPRAAHRAAGAHGGVGAWLFRFLLLLAIVLTAAFWLYPAQVRQAAQQFAVQYEQRQWEQNEGPPLAVPQAAGVDLKQSTGAVLAQRVLASKGAMKNVGIETAPKKVLVIKTVPTKQDVLKTTLGPAPQAARVQGPAKVAPVKEAVAYSPGGDPIPTFSLASFQQTLAVRAHHQAQTKADRAMGIFEGPVTLE